MEEKAPTRDAEYLRGLREAVDRGVRYGIALLADGREHNSDFPIALVNQARLAARQKIPLEVVNRRYLAAKTLFSAYLFEESVALGIHDPSLFRDAIANQEAAFHQLLTLAAEEYKREEDMRSAFRESREVTRVKRLLAGETIDSSSMGYDLECHHLGVIASPPEARQAIRRIAAKTSSRVLIVDAPGDVAWGWLGSKEDLDPDAIRRLAAPSADTLIGIGEPTRSLIGWRLTHR